MPALTIARGNLFQERTRLLISVGGVAFSVILILAGLYRGWQLRVTAYLLFLLQRLQGGVRQAA